MIDNIEGEKPSQQRVVLDKFFRSFLKWALKLSLEDKLTLARFMRAVQQAHSAGKGAPTPAATDAEREAIAEQRPSLVLPGLGGSFIKHQPAGETGASYGDLDSMLPGGKPRGPAN